MLLAHPHTDGCGDRDVGASGGATSVPVGMDREEADS